MEAINAIRHVSYETDIVVVEDLYLKIKIDNAGE